MTDSTVARHAHTPHRFIQETLDKPRAALWGDFKNKHPAISYRYIPEAPGEPFYLTDFKPPTFLDPPVSRLHLCKIWASVTITAILLRWMKRTLVSAATGFYSKYYAHLDIWIPQFEGYQQEIGLAMEVLVDWEAAHHVPRSWKHINCYSTRSLGSNPNRLSLSNATTSGSHHRTLSPLFLYAAVDASEAIRVMWRDNVLLRMMGDAVPHCEYYEFLPRFPIWDNETRLLEAEDGIERIAAAGSTPVAGEEANPPKPKGPSYLRWLFKMEPKDEHINI
ncbi:hypothetical protein IAT38_007081 [Cryptococcus sp. DSM 104549]